MSKQILFNSDSAAYFSLNIHGWVSSDGRFFGSDESSARYAGCTHRLCDCGEIMEKYYTMCASCKEKKEMAAYLLKPKKLWNGTDPLYSEKINGYFFNRNDFFSYLLDHKDEKENFRISLRLVICDPVYLKVIDPYELYNDDLPEDGELPIEIIEAFKTLNKIISSNTVPIAWIPGKYAFGQDPGDRRKAEEEEERRWPDSQPKKEK